MLKIKSNNWMFPACGLAILVLISCHAQPDEQQMKNWENFEGPGEMKPGPGLFSGEDGKFTLYSSEKGGLFPKDAEGVATEPLAEQTTETIPTTGAGSTAVGSQAASKSVQKPDKSQDYREFQEFQQWQKEKAQFHEYQEWKKSGQGSAEFNQFQEYQQWRKTGKGSSDFKEFQEYQRWKKSGRTSAEYKEFLEWQEFKAYQEWKKRQQQ